MYDAYLDALISDAPDVEDYIGDGGKGDYPIAIRGIPGAYYVGAPEFSNEGAFSTLEEAVAWVECNFSDDIARAASRE